MWRVRVGARSYEPFPDLRLTVTDSILRPGLAEFLSVEEPWSPRIAEIWEGLGRPELHYRADPDEDFEWLPGSGVTWLSIWGPAPRSHEAIARTESLRSLTVRAALRPPLDVSGLVGLVELVVDAGAVVGYEDLPGLERLVVSHLRAPDASSLVRLPRLEYLRLSDAPLTSLHGLEGMGRLAEISLVRLPGLVDMAPLAGLPRLIGVDGYTLPALRDLSPLASVRSLEYLHLAGCRGIESIAELRRLPALRSVELLGSTSVADGNIAVLRDFPALTSLTIEKGRPHYNAKPRDIQRDVEGPPERPS
jgi:hypothetical protein